MGVETHPALLDGTRVRVSYTRTPDDASFEPVTCDIRSASWTWGTTSDEGVFRQVEESGFILTAHDPKRTLQAVVGSLFRVYLDWTHVYAGTVREVRWEGDDVEVACLDDLGLLSRVVVKVAGPTGLPAQTAQQRIWALLDLAGWPSTARDIEDNTTPLVPLDLADKNVWECIAEVARTTGGPVWVDQGGTFVSRKRATAWTAEEARFTLGCDGIPLRALRLASRDDRVGNLITASDTASPAGTYTTMDVESQRDYGLRTILGDGLLFSGNTANYLRSWADFVLDRHKAPWTTVEAATFGYAKQVGSARWGARWDVVDEHHGPRVVVRGRLLGLAYAIAPEGVTVTATLGRV
jgi:hypothetical protein